MTRGLLLAACLLTPAFAAAHEIGTTDVRLALSRDGKWSATITTGPQALVNKLEVASGRPRSSTLDADGLQQQLHAFLPDIASHLDVRFDGQRSNVTVSIARIDVPADASRAAFAVLRVTGDSRPGAATVSWRDDLMYSTYALVLEREGRAPVTTWIEAEADSGPVPLDAARSSVLAVTGEYVRLGFVHILPRGLDHILFVLGLFLLTRAAKPLLLQVTAFTVAHSLTLALTMAGGVALPASVVEPLIALSIAYVAVENMVTTRLTPWRPVVVFGFGLLHGMGFAGVLRGLPLPEGHFVPALAGFNAGIELAQLSVLGLAFLCTAAWRIERTRYRTLIAVPVSAAIAVTALVWAVERMLAL